MGGEGGGGAKIYEKYRILSLQTQTVYSHSSNKALLLRLHSLTPIVSSIAMASSIIAAPIFELNKGIKSCNNSIVTSVFILFCTAGQPNKTFLDPGYKSGQSTPNSPTDVEFFSNGKQFIFVFNAIIVSLNCANL